MTLPLWVTALLAAAESVIAGWWKAVVTVRREEAEKSEREKSVKTALEVKRDVEVLDDVDVAKRAREWVRDD